jgi:hypothetical protein
MRVRDHIALSTAGAVLLSPWFGRRVFAPWAASIAVDIDHYLWFCLSRRRWDPVAAVRLFNEANPPQHAATRVFHGRWSLLTTALLGVHRRGARGVLLGMATHVAFDAYHERRMDETRVAALLRDDHTCRMCGIRRSDLGTHLWRQPRLLPCYGPQNHITLCDTCHEAAHALPEVVSRRAQLVASAGGN